MVNSCCNSTIIKAFVWLLSLEHRPRFTSPQLAFYIPTHNYNVALWAWDYFFLKLLTMQLNSRQYYMHIVYALHLSFAVNTTYA